MGIGSPLGTDPVVEGIEGAIAIGRCPLGKDSITGAPKGL